MTTYKARVDYTYSGSANFSIPFPYIEKSHIIVFINGIQTTDFIFTTNSQLTINAELSNGDKISIRRSTPIDIALVNFTDTSILDRDVQNMARNQLLFRLQETEDMYANTLTEEEAQAIVQNCVTYTYINEICDYSTMNTEVTNVTQNVENIQEISGLYQKQVMLTNGVVNLSDDTTIYTSTPVTNTTYTFNTSNLTETGKVITFELQITQPVSAVQITLPESITWLNETVPDLSVANQTYLLVFRSYDNGTTWIGNLQGVF